MYVLTKLEIGLNYITDTEPIEITELVQSIVCELLMTIFVVGLINTAVAIWQARISHKLVSSFLESDWQELNFQLELEFQIPVSWLC